MIILAFPDVLSSTPTPVRLSVLTTSSLEHKLCVLSFDLLEF